MRDRPTSEQVKAYRDEHETSLQEAVAVVSKQWRRDCLSDIRSKAGELYTVEQCRDVIVDLIDLVEVLVERGP